MTFECSDASHKRARVGFHVSAAALFCLVVAMAHAQQSSVPEPEADARSIRPATTITTRPQINTADVPTINLASPRPLVLKIGSSYSDLKLSGAHLARVTQATVMTSDNQVAAGFKARLASRNRTDGQLLLSLIASAPVAPGDYLLRLTYEVDDPKPQTSPARTRRPIVRTVAVSASKVTIRAKAMSPSITSTTPESPQVGREYAGITVFVADLPGKEVVSVTRSPYTGGRGCAFEPHYLTPKETHATTWRGENSLEIQFSPGTLIPDSASGCSLRFSLRTQDELGGQFLSLVEKSITFRPDPRKAYAVSNTWELNKYLHFKLLREPADSFGVCSGTSPGTSGLIPVGLLKESGDINLRIRSGPIGTKCTWMVYASGLRNGWEMRMMFEKKQVGSKCDVGDRQSPRLGVSFDFNRAPDIYHSGGLLTLYYDNPQGPTPGGFYGGYKFTTLSCGVTVTNDHGVTMRMVSAELFGEGGPNCTWKCGVVN